MPDNPKNRRWTFLVIASGLAISIGVFGWWLGRRQGHGGVEPVNPSANPSGGEFPATPVTEKSVLPPVIEESFDEGVPHGGADQVDAGLSPSQPGDSLEDWIINQAWYRQLKMTMPAGVSLSVGAFPGDNPGWDMVEIREIHSPESGFDTDVSPMVGLFQVSSDRQRIQWMDSLTGEWKSIDAFIKDRGLSGAADMAATEWESPYRIYFGDFEGEAPDGSPYPPLVVEDPKNSGNLVGLIKAPEPLQFELPVDDASAAGGAVTIAFRIYVPEITRSTDGGTLHLRVSLIGANDLLSNREIEISSGAGWKSLAVRFEDPPSPLYGVSLGAADINGAIFFDDLKFAK
ncbi:MAG: hypothetical protein KDN19_12800 [Verrucomicrobiae bacterium]|nr:hypothetical protein [Verrucomicrobiae bacterium]